MNWAENKKKMKKIIKETCEKTGDFLFANSWVIAIVSLVWYLLRTGTNPKRAVYPCQQAAKANFVIFGIPLGVSLVHRFKKCKNFRMQFLTMAFLVLSIGSLVVSQAYKYIDYEIGRRQNFDTGANAQGAPSRVVWVIDEDSTMNGAVPRSYTDAWDEKVNAVVVEQMMDSAIVALMGTQDDPDPIETAWTNIFTQHNGGSDYVPGEKIYIKVNFNATVQTGICTGNQCPLYEVTNAVVRQLVEEKGIDPSYIYVYDTSKEIKNKMTPGLYDYCTGVTSAGEGGYISLANINPGLHEWSAVDVDSVRYPEVYYSTRIQDADYIVNLPIVRSHGLTGGTFSFKNHFGSICLASHGHDYVAIDTSPAENSLVAVNMNEADPATHESIIDKTLIIVAEGYYVRAPASENDCGPGDLPNLRESSLFVSRDPVAIDSVLMDFLESNSIEFDNCIPNGNPRNYLVMAESAGLGNYDTSGDTGFDFTYNEDKIELVECPDGTCPGMDPPPDPPDDPPDPPDEVDTSPVYRFWSDTYGHHFYTISSSERDYVMQNWPNIWSYEGAVYDAVRLSGGACVSGTTPLYRFWSDSYRGHFYTASLSERNFVMENWPNVWSYEGPAYCVDNNTDVLSRPVYRFWSDSLHGHFYTASVSERNFVMENWPNVWSYEGTVFYVD